MYHIGGLEEVLMEYKGPTLSTKFGLSFLGYVVRLQQVIEPVKGGSLQFDSFLQGAEDRHECPWMKFGLLYTTEEPMPCPEDESIFKYSCCYD